MKAYEDRYMFSGRFIIGKYGGPSGIMVIIAGNGHGDTSSNPG